MQHTPHPQGTARTGAFSAMWTACAVLLLATPAQAEAVLEQARRLLDAKQGPAAYEQLVAHLEQRAGEPDYDLLLARAALEAGQPAVAVFALERVLAQRPDDGPALLALGRAHMLMGEAAAARRSLLQAARQPLGATERAAVDRYLDAIGRRTVRPRPHLGGHIELGAGYDSNINSATSDKETTLFIWGGPYVTPLQDSSLGRSDRFLRLRGGVDYAGPLTAATRLLLGARADLRRHDDHDVFDNDSFDGYAGLRWLQGRNRYSALLRAQQFRIDGQTNRELAGLTLQWDRILDARNQLAFFVQGAALRYPDQGLRDVDQHSVGATWSHARDAAGTPLLYLGAYAGADREKDPVAPEYGQQFWGLRAGADFSLGRNLGLGATVRWHDGKHDDEEWLFATRRHDQQLDLSLGLNYRLGAALSLRPQLRYTRNDSNINIYEFERSQFQLALRYDFH